MTQFCNKPTLHALISLCFGLLLAGYSMMAYADITAIGYGKDVNLARANALTALSQTILANVESETTEELKVNKDGVNRSGNKKLQIRSNLLLKGVRYQQLENVDGEIQMMAGLDSKALHQTVKFLKQETTFDISNLQVALVPELKLKNTMQLAILSAAGGEIRNSQRLYVEAQQKADELDKRLTHSIWKPNLNGVDAVIKINGKRVDPKKPIFLEVGRHDYLVTAEGYRDIEGIIKASPAKLIPVTFDWIFTSQRQVILDSGEKLSFIDDEAWQDTLDNAGLGIVDNAEVILKVRLKEQVNSSGDYKQHTLRLEIGFYRRGIKLKKIKMKKKVFAKSGDDQIVEDAVLEMLNRALPVLASKTRF